MSRALNCPNCGAPLGMKDVCEYCGTHFIDFTMDTEEPFYIKIRHKGKVVIDRVRLIGALIQTDPQPVLYGDYIEGMPCGIRYTMPERTYKMEMMSLGIPGDEIDKFRRGL